MEYKQLLRTIKLNDNRKLRFFILGLIFFYTSLFFVNSKLWYFFLYIITGLIFYWGGLILNEIILFLLTLSIFFDVGIAGRWFILEPQNLDLGSGWWVSAMTILTAFLGVLIFLKRDKKLKLRKDLNSSDIFIFLFLLWNILSFILFVNINSLLGIIQLSEVIIIYFLLRLYLDKIRLKYTVVVIISIFLFQLIVSLGQFIVQRPLGLLVEPIIQEKSQTLFTIEGADLFRVTGTFGHPNMLAAFLIATVPFIFLLTLPSSVTIILNFLIFLIVFLTYSRISWLFFAIEYFVIWNSKKMTAILQRKFRKNLIILAAGVLFAFYIILPYFLVRLNTIGASISEFGSIGIRVKMIQEASNLIRNAPIFGVGLNRSLEKYAIAPVTNIFSQREPTSFYKIHNSFLEIASESGIPGVAFFILFIISVIFSKQKKVTNRYLWFYSIIGFSGLLIVSYVNPFFHTPIFRILILLAAIILA